MYNKQKTRTELAAIRESGRMLAEVLRIVVAMAKPGVTGTDIDAVVNKEMKAFGATPAFLGYQGFPNSICISINDAVVHGIPSSKPFKEGDIVGFDCGVLYKRMISDAARTVIIGNKATNAQRSLVDATKRSLDEAIDQIKHGSRVGDISEAAQKVLDKNGYGIVRDLVGHGVGHSLHEGPEIPNYGMRGTGKVLKERMTIAVEPMATLGGWQVVMDPDGWTVRTRDGSVSAHFEDTILVTLDGYEILTR